MSKQFGLIVPGKSKPLIGAVVQRPAIFDEDSDSDEEIEKPTGLKTALKRQDRVVQEKAVEEDPTVYQYDEIYDEMEQKRKQSKLSRKDLDKKPKYINRLLETANRRKQENERRIERQIQKEREAEGDEFKDKEAFVTTSYRKKLEEMKKQEEEEKREEYLEAIGDVRKQGNLDGFYRHLYDQKVNHEDKQREAPDEGEEKDGGEVSRKRKTSTNVRERKYRKRDDSDSEDAGEVQAVKLEHLPSNLDADSDFSIDSESDDETNGDENKEAATCKEGVKNENAHDEDGEDGKSPVADVKVEGSVKEDEVKNVEREELSKEEVKPKKLKINIWKKRTVGVVFEEALQRYFERKALREAGV